MQHTTIKVKQIFTSAASSPVDMVEKLRQRLGNNVVYVTDTTLSIEDCDVVVASSLASLMRIGAFLTKDMVIIVCDSPLILSAISGAIPLDFSQATKSYLFQYNAPDYKKVIAAVKSKNGGVDLLAEPFDVMGMITQHNVKDAAILPAYNAVQAFFDPETRAALRNIILSILVTAEEGAVAALKKFLIEECTAATQKKVAKDLIDALKENAPKLRQALAEKTSNPKASSGTLAKKFGVSEFELNYFIKMQNKELLVTARQGRLTTKGKQANGNT